MWFGQGSVLASPLFSRTRGGVTRLEQQPLNRIKTHFSSLKGSDWQKKKSMCIHKYICMCVCVWLYVCIFNWFKASQADPFWIFFQPKRHKATTTQAKTCLHFSHFLMPQSYTDSIIDWFIYCCAMAGREHRILTYQLSSCSEHHFCPSETMDLTALMQCCWG